MSLRSPGLRKATEQDIPVLCQIATAAYVPYVSRLGREPLAMPPDFSAHVAAGQCWLLERAAVPIAYVIQGAKHGGWFADNVAVHPRHQGQGLGRVLFAEAEDAAREGRYAIIRLFTNEVMTENQALYRRLGYRETGRRTHRGMRIIDFANTTDRSVTSAVCRPKRRVRFPARGRAGARGVLWDRRLWDGRRRVFRRRARGGAIGAGAAAGWARRSFQMPCGRPGPCGPAARR